MSYLRVQFADYKYASIGTTRVKLMGVIKPKAQHENSPPLFMISKIIVH